MIPEPGTAYEPTPIEAQTLARKILADRLEDVESWLHWEDYPELSERAFRDLCERIKGLARVHREVVKAHERVQGFDVGDLVERAIGADRGGH